MKIVALMLGIVIAAAAGQVRAQDQSQDHSATGAQPQAPETNMPPPGPSDSKHLSETGGVVQPPKTGDRAVVTPPNPGDNSTPVIPPPGTPGGNPAIQPK